MPEPSVSLTIRLPYELYKRLNAEATRRGYRVQNSMIVSAIDEYLDGLKTKEECANCKHFVENKDDAGEGTCDCNGIETDMENGPCNDFAAR